MGNMCESRPGSQSIFSNMRALESDGHRLSHCSSNQMQVRESGICCSLYLPPKFTSRTVHSRRHAAALSCRRLRFACTPGQEWASQNLDLYESGWLSLTGYSQCYFPEWLTMMAASLARAASQRSGSTDQLTALPKPTGYIVGP